MCRHLMQQPLHHCFAMLRRGPLFGAVALSLGVASVHAASPAEKGRDAMPITERGTQISGPDQDDRGEPEWQARMDNWRRDPGGTHAAWLRAMRLWRDEQRRRIHFDDAQYRRPDMQWTRRSFVQAQVMVEDRLLYDPVKHRYTVSRLLDDLRRRYGGIDSVLLWPVYPNSGVDPRNQLDLLRDMPGGVAGVRAMVRDFQHEGVRVFFPTMPWDVGTRDEGLGQAEATVELFAAIGADGVNGDTMAGLPEDFLRAAQARGMPLALEPELPLRDDAMLAYNTLSWGYWQTPFVPLVSKWKWLEPRHMVHVCDRWATDRNEILQAAFFNGTGIQSWENVWGWWNGITPRDAAALKRMAGVYRGWPALLSSADWEPHVSTGQYGVYASRFPGETETLWTVVNRNDFAVTELPLTVAHEPMARYVDAWNGRELKAVVGADGRATVTLELEPRGFGALVQLRSKEAVAAAAPVLAAQLALAARPLASYSREWRASPQRIVAQRPSPRVKVAPPGMVTVPAMAAFEFRVTGLQIEGENRPGLDVQYPWESVARREHVHRMAVSAFHIDRHPVTNEAFARFLSASGYRPSDDHNYLAHWQAGGPIAGDLNRPVVWVGLEDARAYCRWAGKRLPHEWEWQYAAQGGDGRSYPWGADWRDDHVPTVHTGRGLPVLAEVGQFPQAASPFGVQEMLGHVWQWTDEFQDRHTRAAILRGGSPYLPQGASWYFPNARRLDQHGKLLLMAPSKDRSGLIGFRCVADAD